MSNDRNSDNIIYIPSIKSCRDYGISRFPTKYSSSDGYGDGLPDFLSGGQFSNWCNPHIRSINTIETSTKENNSMDEVLIEVLTNTPYVPELKKRVVNGIEEWDETYSTDSQTPEFYFRIAPTWESISQEKTHKWEAPQGILSQVLEGVSSLVGGIDDILTTSRNTGNKNRKSAHVVKQNDIVNQYQSTNKETIEIPFILFTKDDFVNDIFYPIMMLTALSYPVRINMRGLHEKIMKESTDKIISEFGDDMSRRERKTAKNNPSDFIRNIMGDNRLFLSTPPPYLRVSHTSNLFFYPHMNIINFDYSFQKPFYNIKNNKMQSRSFPLVAECVLTLRASDLLLSDHYLNMIGRFADNSDSKIEISDTRTPQTNEPNSVTTPEQVANRGRNQYVGIRERQGSGGQGGRGRRN